MKEKSNEIAADKRKVNLFDILIIIFIIAAVAAAAWWLLKVKINVEDSFKVIYTIEFRGVPDEPYEQDMGIMINKSAYDAVKGYNLGKIISFKNKPYVNFRYDLLNGRIVFDKVSNNLTYYMEIEADVEVKENGRLFVNDYIIAYGKRVDLKTDGFIGNGRITNIKIIKESE